KPSPLYETLKEKGAVYEEVFGHERPRWFAPEGTPAEDIYGFRRTALHDIVGAECRAVRERVGIMDISAFTKVEVSGPDAAALLDRLVANKLPGKVGGIALTHMLDRRGRIVIETTVIRTGEDRYYLVCAAFFEQRLLDHLDTHREAEDVQIVCLSEGWSALALNGPLARDVLSACTSADLSNAGFRWLTAQWITIAGHELLAMRISYAGELGWEFHMPRAAAPDVYRALWAAGEAHGIADYGSFAMNALRMEKAFPGAGELTNEVTLPEANVMRFVKLDKSYLGLAETEASVAEMADGQSQWVCAYLAIEPDGDADGHGGEAVLKDGQLVGSTASVAYGHSVGKIMAFAYISPAAAVPGTALEVVIMGQPRAARVLGEAAYDPQSLLPRTDAMEVAAQ
ncbi:MAG: aminomethyltransferase family protein, partial [Pseudomonadota bacterium]